MSRETPGLVYSKKPLTNEDVFRDLPKKKCHCGSIYTPTIRNQRDCSDACFSKRTNIEMPKEEAV